MFCGKSVSFGTCCGFMLVVYFLINLYTYIEEEVMKFIKNYKSTILLILAIIIGGIVGIVLGEDSSILKPFGDIFLNMLLVVIVPLIFLSISTSIYKMKQPKRMGKILMVTFGMFLVTSVIAVTVGIVSTYSLRLVSTSDGEAIKEELSLNESSSGEVELNLLEKLVETSTVDDFSKLLSRDNMIALIVVSILFGFAMHMSGDRALGVFNFLDSLNDVVMSFIKIITYYAPIGVGCYFAALVGTFGGEIAVGYFKTFVIYLVVSILFYFIVYTIYAYVSAGKNGVVAFWRNILPATFTSLATCSSAASMPINIECSKKMGISSDVAETTVSLGTSFHKDGSVIGSVFKIMCLVYLFNDVGSISVFEIMWISIIATLLVTAVPIGGGTISEMLIITMLGYPVATLPILTMIATIIDPPATVLNVVGDSASAMLTSRIIDGKGWFKKKAN